MTNSELPVSAFDLKEWRGQFIRVVLRIASILGIIMIGVSFPTASFTDRILFISLYLILLIVTLTPTPYMLRAYLLLGATAIVGVNAIVAWGPWADGSLFLLTTIVLAALLLDNRTDVILLVGAMVFSTTVAVMNLQGNFNLTAPLAPETDLSSWGVYVIDFSIAGILLTTATNMLKSAFARVTSQVQAAFLSVTRERESLEEKVRERTEELETRMSQLRASATTARAIAEEQEITELINKAVNLIGERFEYYHVGIYILDTQRRIAYLQASSSVIGKSLIGQAFRIEPDRKNPISLVVENNKTIITHDLENRGFVQDKNFPLTRSRMALPLSVRGHMIGILDIHSDQQQAFSSQDAEILQTLADLTAISFDNVRLIGETRSLLSQVEASTSQQTQQTWSKLTSRHKSAYQYTPAGVRPIFTPEKKHQSDGLYIPIVLHDQTIGRIKLKKRNSSVNDWSERERDVVEKISTQIALALENSRLVDEAQRNALRNQMIANFSTYVRETLDVESVIRTATTELRKVFDLKEAEILIGAGNTPQDERETTS